MPEKAITLYNTPLTSEQAAKLKAILIEDGYRFEPRPYTLYFAQKDKLTIAVYEKGPKAVLQGKGTEEFVRFRLEPEILGEAKLGYEEELNPEMYSPHFGIDESGKGDSSALSSSPASTRIASTRAQFHRLGNHGQQTDHLRQKNPRPRKKPSATRVHRRAW